jgi:putative ribosome biogenesis GTPase RsgA
LIVFSNGRGLIETILVFNKIDTFDEATLDEQLYMQHVYQEIDINASRFLYGNERIEQLKEMMIGKVSMFHILVLENQLWLTLWNLRYT